MSNFFLKKCSCAMFTYPFIPLLAICLFMITSCDNIEIVTSNGQHANKIDLLGKTEGIQLFGPGVISTSLYERDLAISPGKDEIIFTVGDHLQTNRYLVSIKLHEEGWSDPEILNISGQFQDIEPFFANDGDVLYFASNRPMINDTSRSDYNIWYANRMDDGWSEPRPLDTLINTSGDEFFPSLSRSGNIYFTATRSDGFGKEDIYVSHFNGEEFEAPIALPVQINTPYYEFNAFIDPDENYIIFSSYGRPDGHGGGDLYLSVKDNSGNWSVAQNLGSPVNSEKLDYCPFVDPVAKRLYFTSERKEKHGQRISKLSKLKQWSEQPLNGFGNIFFTNLALPDSTSQDQ